MSTTRKSFASDAVLNVSSPFDPGASSPVAVSATETATRKSSRAPASSPAVAAPARSTSGASGAVGGATVSVVSSGGSASAASVLEPPLRLSTVTSVPATTAPTTAAPRPSGRPVVRRRRGALLVRRGASGADRRGASALRTEGLRRVAGVGVPAGVSVRRATAGCGAVRGLRAASSGDGADCGARGRPDRALGSRGPRRGGLGCGGLGCRHGRRAGSGRAPVPRRRRVVARRRTGYPDVPGRRAAERRGRHERRGCPVTCGGGHRPGSGQHRDTRALGRAVARRSGDGPAGAVRTGASR